MTDHVHPRVTQVLHRAHRLQALMDRELAKRESRTFTGTDDGHIAEVTLDGRTRATVVVPDLRMLNDLTATDRITAAHRAASAEFDAMTAADADRIEASIAEITGSAQQSRGDDA